MLPYYQMENPPVKGRLTYFHQQEGKEKLTCNFAEFEKEEEEDTRKNRSADISAGCTSLSSAVL